MSPIPAVAGGLTGLLLTAIVNAVPGTAVTGSLGLAVSVCLAVLTAALTVRAPSYALAVLAASLIFPVQLQPYNVTVTVAAGTYVGLAVRVVATRTRVMFGASLIATIVLALTIAGTTMAAVVTGTALVPDGGFGNSRLFLLLMGITVVVPPLLAASSPKGTKGLLMFCLGLVAGCSIWSLYEYPARLGLIPSLASFQGDQLEKPYAGALSGPFEGGGPNTYAIFLAPVLLVAITASAALPARWSRVGFLVVGLMMLTFAFTYSRGGIVALVGGVVWLLIRWRSRAARAHVIRSVALAAVCFAVAWAVALTLSPPVIGGDENRDTWRAYLARPDWLVQQRIPVPPDNAGLLWIRARAATGADFVVDIRVDGEIVYSGIDALRARELRWIAFPFRPGLLLDKGSVVVAISVRGTTNERDSYLDIGGTTRVDHRYSPSFGRKDAQSQDDLSFDPGQQVGRYLIQLEPPSDVLAPLPTVPSTSPSPLSAEATRTTPLFALDDERSILWNAAIRAFIARPLFGGGFYTSRLILEHEPTPIPYSNVHNQYLQFMVDHGALGLMALVAFFIALIGSQPRRQGLLDPLAIGVQAGAIALSVGFLFGSFLADSRVASTVWLLAGVATYLANHRSGDTGST